MELGRICGGHVSFHGWEGWLNERMLAVGRLTLTRRTARCFLCLGTPSSTVGVLGDIGTEYGLALAKGLEEI